MSFSASLTGPPLCHTCWNPGLPLWELQRQHWTHCQLLLWPVWHWHDLCFRLDHWIRTLAANALNTLPCRRLWHWGWVVKRKWLKYSSYGALTPCHRWSHLTKLPWQLHKQSGEDGDVTGRRGIDPFFTIHCIWHWIRIHLWLRPPDNHGRWKDNLDGEELWILFASKHNQHKQHRQPGVHHRWQRYKAWLECQMECSNTRWVSTTCLDYLH